MLAQQRGDAVRRRPVGQQHRGGADRQGKRHGVAEAVGEEQFRHRIADVAFLEARDRRAVEIGGQLEAGVDVHRALRLAGGARSVEPERHVVGDGRRGVILRLVGADNVVEQPVAVWIIAGDDDVLEVRAFLDQLLEFREQRLRHHQAFGPAVGQHEAVIVLGEQSIDRHGDDAGLEAAEKRDRPVDGIEHGHQHALFAADAEATQRRAEARHPVGELAVGQRAARIDIGRLAGAAGGEVALQHIGGEVVIAWDMAQRDMAHRLGRALVCRACIGGCHCFSSPDGSYYAEGTRTPQCRVTIGPPPAMTKVN